MKTLPFFFPPMLANLPVVASLPVSLAAFGWSVHYVLNFPTGHPVRAVLHYNARSAEDARRCFTYEVNRSQLLNPLFCSVIITEIKPYGPVND